MELHGHKAYIDENDVQQWSQKMKIKFANMQLICYLILLICPQLKRFGDQPLS